MHTKLVTDRPTVNAEFLACRSCPFVDNCNTRLDYNLWVACEIPSMSDIMVFIDNLYRGNDLYHLLWDVASADDKRLGLPYYGTVEQISQTIEETIIQVNGAYREAYYKKEGYYPKSS